MERGLPNLNTRIALIAGLICAVPASVRGQDLAWFASRWEEARTYTLPENTRIVFERSPTFRVDPAEIDRLKKEVAGKPDHPSRAKLGQLQVQVDTTGELRTSTIWWGSSGWRHSRDWEEKGVRKFFDVAVHGDTAWGWDPGVLNVVATESAPVGNDYPAMVREVRTVVAECVWGGMGVGTDTPIRLRPTAFERIEGGRWKGRAASHDDKRVFEYRGSFEQDGSLRVEQSECVVSSDNPSFVGRTVKFSNFVYDSVLQRQVSREWVSSGQTGKEDTRTVLKSVESISENDLMRAIVVPIAGQQDPVRGEVRLEIVQDLRPSSMTRTLLAGGE